MLELPRTSSVKPLSTSSLAVYARATFSLATSNRWRDFAIWRGIHLCSRLEIRALALDRQRERKSPGTHRVWTPQVPGRAGSVSVFWNGAGDPCRSIVKASQVKRTCHFTLTCTTSTLASYAEDSGVAFQCLQNVRCMGARKVNAPANILVSMISVPATHGSLQLERMVLHRVVPTLINPGESYENFTCFSYRSYFGNSGDFWLREYYSRYGCRYSQYRQCNAISG